MSSSKSSTHKRTLRCDAFTLDVNGDLTVPLSKVRNISEVYNVTYGNNYRDWRERIRQCQDATTTLTGTRRGHIKSHPGACTVTRISDNKITQIYFGDLLCNYFDYVDASNVLSTAADRKASSKFLAHYIDKTNTWRGGNFLAEIRETIHMLAHPLKSFYQATWSFAGKIGKLKRVYRKDPFNAKKALADAWLAYSFGVKPLIADCNDFSNAVVKLANGTGHDTTTVSGFGRETTMTTSMHTGANFVVGDPGTHSAKFLDTSKFDNTVRYKGALRARPESPATVAEQFGVGVFDVIPAVWEAIPWSFFIDYFANVGEMIDSMRLWDADFAWCYRTIRNSATRNANNLLTKPDNTSYRAVSSGGGFYCLSTYVNRGSSSIPRPGFHFQMPGFPSLKWLNIAALAEQVAKI